MYVVLPLQWLSSAYNCAYYGYHLCLTSFHVTNFNIGPLEVQDEEKNRALSAWYALWFQDFYHDLGKKSYFQKDPRFPKKRLKNCVSRDHDELLSPPHWKSTFHGKLAIISLKWPYQNCMKILIPQTTIGKLNDPKPMWLSQPFFGTSRGLHEGFTCRTCGGLRSGGKFKGGEKWMDFMVQNPKKNRFKEIKRAQTTGWYDMIWYDMIG